MMTMVNKEEEASPFFLYQHLLEEANMEATSKVQMEFAVSARITKLNIEA